MRRCEFRLENWEEITAAAIEMYIAGAIENKCSLMPSAHGSSKETLNDPFFSDLLIEHAICAGAVGAIVAVEMV